MAEADPGGDLAAAVGAALDRLVPAGPVGVAVSGGGDSMALLAISAAWAERRGRGLSAVTVDHRLRPDSAGEAAFVAAECARIGVPHRTLVVTALPPGNLQAAAREARYRLMAEWAHAGGLASVLLGHTLDDQAETLLMRLGRGSGVEGLAAMAPRREWLGVAWIRPMLEVRRQALRDWLGARGLGWLEDPTNDDLAYERVRARRALAALEPLGITAEGLAGTARLLARQRRVLARAAAQTALKTLKRGAFGEVRLALRPLRETERDTALRVFADALMQTTGRGYRPRSRSLEPLLARILDGDADAATLAGCLIVPDAESDTALICREPAAVEDPVPLALPETVWDNRWRLSVPAGLPAGLHAGALGAVGCDRLGREAREGAWHPLEAWSASPRPVRETVPAIYAGRACAPYAMLAVPPAGWLAPDAPSDAAGIGACPSGPGDALA